MPTGREREFVTVYRAWGEVELQVVKGLLESSGIECRLVPQGPRSIYPVTVDGLAEVWIMVPRERAEEAQALIAAYQSQYQDQDRDQDQDQYQDQEEGEREEREPEEGEPSGG